MARILVTNFHPSGGGGHIPYILALTKLSEHPDFTIGVSTPEGSRLYKQLKESSYPFLYSCDFPAKIQKEFPDVIRSIHKFREIVSNFKPDIVHTNGAADLSISAWSHPISCPYKIVRTHHAIRNISDNIYHRWLYTNRAEHNIYVSQPAFDLSTTKGLTPSNPIIIENGVDTERFRPIKKNIELSKLHHIDDACFCFGSCAGTGNYKRIDIIIDAAAEIKKRGLREFRILVLGDESSGLALQKIAEEKGVDEFIFCGFHEQVENYISLFDVGFILSDSIETISFAAREMLSMGKPLISSSFSGLKENIQDGVNGFLVKPGNVNDVALAMTRFLEMDKQTLDIFSLRARERAIKDFDIGKQITAHGTLYEHIIQCG